LLKLGEKVLVTSLKSEGIVTALSESEAEVQIGTLRVRARLSDLERKQAVASDQSSVTSNQLPVTKEQSSVVRRPVSNVGMEISLRGKLVEDGLDELDKYLEKAFSAGLPFVRIVHGKGTGRMRQAVRTALKDSPYVKSFEEAHENEGGAGVTIAVIAR